MFEPANVGFKEHAQVGNAVFKHGETFYAHAESEALPFFRIDAAIAQHVGMYHAAAHDFQPVFTGADFDLTAVSFTADIHFCRRFGEGKEAWAETDGYVIEFKEGAQKCFNAALEVAHIDVLINTETFNLMEHRGVGQIRIAAEGFAGSDEAERRFTSLHGANLHGRSVSSE